ncbi:MAG TPA: flagellar export chaperone FlgN [Candidatus Kapabacteria bacterium]|nr:flagellar export chaperone FlgN [Candidatus Kapabacteria bacterium]
MFYKFLTFLKFEEQLLNELLRLSQRQQTAIVKNNIQEIQEINSYQSELNKNLLKTEEERMLILSNWLNISRADSRKVKISDLKKYLSKDEVKELQKVQKNFDSLVSQLLTTNNTNRMLINRARINIKEMIDYLTNGTQNVCNIKV